MVYSAPRSRPRLSRSLVRTIYPARFKIINGLGLYGSPSAPILIYVAFDLMQLYIYRQFLANLSTSLDESALLDGYNYFQLFTKIIFPMMAADAVKE